MKPFHCTPTNISFTAVRTKAAPECVAATTCGFTRFASGRAIGIGQTRVVRLRKVSARPSPLLHSSSAQVGVCGHDMTAHDVTSSAQQCPGCSHADDARHDAREAAAVDVWIMFQLFELAMFGLPSPWPVRSKVARQLLARWLARRHVLAMQRSGLSASSRRHHHLWERNLPSESSSMIPHSRVIAIDWFSLEDLSLSPSASLRPRLEGRGAYGWPPQQPHNAVPLLPVFCFPPAHDQAMEMCKGLFASQILRSFGH